MKSDGFGHADPPAGLARLTRSWRYGCASLTASNPATRALNRRNSTPDNRATLVNEIDVGLIACPFRHTSQCRCGPVDMPVEPT